MEDVAPRIFVEDTVAGKLFAYEILHGIVVEDLAVRSFLRSERDVEVVIEVAAERRHPLEIPPHTFLERFNFFQRRPRNRDKTHVMMFKMSQRPIDVV